MASSPPLPALAAGIHLGRWQLHERLGVGGLADVWQATAEGVSRAVALKVLREPDRSPTHRSRFLREGRLLARLSHPGLPRCHGVLTSPRPAIALDLLSGESLAERLQQDGPLTAEFGEQIAASLLRVLEYLHQNGIVHRDVKASNAFLADDRRVLLLDLGLAADPSDPLTTTLGDVMGTYAYMAPEQIAGAEVDHRADLYSLGVTLYEALAGERPFQARGAAGYLQAHREGECRPLAEVRPDLPARLVDLVERLMARDPVARPPSAGIARALLTGASGADRSLRDPPIVGRAAAVGAIEAAMDAGKAVLLTGEVGTGTGRMAAWAVQRAREEGFETIAIRCRDRAAPGDPVEQLARDLSRIAGPVRAEAEHLARSLEALSGEGRLLLCIEDADRAAPDAARILWGALAAAPALAAVVTASRDIPTFTGHRVKLRPLTPEETWRVLSGMLGTTSPPAGLAHDLHRISGGLPAIVVLAVKELVHRGALVPEGLSDDGGTRWRLDRTAPLEPTTGLVRLFGEVLSSLRPGERRLLEVLSVVGEALPLDTALAIAEVPPDGLTTGPLVQAGLASEERHSDGDWLLLRRPALAPLVLEEVSAARQTRIHRRLAAALRELPEDPWRDEQIAWHEAHGADPDDAPAALLALGEQLRARGQHARALDVLGRAGRMEGGTPAVTVALAISRGEVLDSVSRRTEAVDALTAGRTLAVEHGLPRLQARALVALAQARHRGGDEHLAADLAHQAIALLAPYETDPSLPRALLLAATAHRLRAETDPARALYQRCVAAARTLDDPATAAMADGGLGILLAEQGSLDEALVYLEREAGHLRAHGQAARLVPALYRLAITLRRLGRLDEAMQCLDEAEDAARFAHLPYERARVDVGRAAIHLVAGDLDGTEAWLERGKVALHPDADAFLRLSYREVQADVRMARGDRQGALAVFQSAETEANGAGIVAGRAYFLGMMGVLTADPDALLDAMDVLSIAGDRRQTARVLLLGALTGDDPEILAAAEEEARVSGDIFMLLDVLGSIRTAEAAAEARALCARVLDRLPGGLQASFRRTPSARWALGTSRTDAG
ncbi:MAG: protein kinase [Myxococcota bacterium]|nr:protein kinase [Myxococcota bacterium]